VSSGGFIIRSVLLEKRMPFSGLINLNVFRLSLPANKLQRREVELGISVPESSEDRGCDSDPFARCFELLREEYGLVCYVEDPMRGCCFPIRNEAFLDGCRIWAALDSIIEGRLITKPALLCRGCIDERLDGNSLYVREAAINRAFEIRPTSLRQMKKIIDGVIQTGREHGYPRKNADLFTHVKNHPEVWGWRDTPIRDLITRLKPPEWQGAGRPRK
jgi:hypothetical protein